MIQKNRTDKPGEEKKSKKHSGIKNQDEVPEKQLTEEESLELLPDEDEELFKTAPYEAPPPGEGP